MNLKNKTAVFFKTESRSRGGIYADIKFFSYGKVVEELLKGNCIFNNYVIIHDDTKPVYNQRSMLVEDYETLFGHLNLSPEIVSKCFGKVVCEKYGVEGIAKKSKRIPKKDLVIGQSYMVNELEEYVYLGKMHKFVGDAALTNNDYTEYYGFIQVYSDTDADDLEKTLASDNRYSRVDTYKSMKRFVKEGRIKINVPKICRNGRAAKIHKFLEA